MTKATMTLPVEFYFSRMGARVEVTRVPNRGHSVGPDAPRTPVRIDVARDAGGAYFQVERLWNVSLSVPDATPGDRHLLLVAENSGHGPGEERFSRFLCGLDERDWFVAAIPETSAAGSVREAKDALKPREVWEAIRECDLPPEQYDLRWTAAFVRQGEWFFLPRPTMEVDHAFVLRNEPIQRGGGKAHWCDFVYRTGGVEVFVCPAYPNGLTVEEYQKLEPQERRKHYWRQMTRDAEVYARGCVRHPDHQTIDLPCWHKVVMNTETKARAMEHVAFLD